MDKFLASVKTFFAAVDQLRVPPSRIEFPEDTRLTELSKLAIAAILLFVARSAAAGSGGSSSQTTLLMAIAAILFLLVGLAVRVALRGQNAEQTSNRVATFIFLYWLLCLVAVCITDVPLLILSQRPLGAYLFDDLPSKLFDLDVPVLAVDVCRALFVALVGWIFLTIKTRLQWPGFRIGDAFLSIEFPIYLSINAALMFLLVFRIYGT